MDQVNCQPAYLIAPHAAQAIDRDSGAASLAYLQAAPDGPTRRWNGALRLGLQLYAATCVRELSVRYQAPLPPGPKIIAFNHANVTDAFLLPSVFPGLICFLAQANLFDLPIIGQLLTLAGQLPVVRGQPVALVEAATRRLHQGYSIGICPEGRLNHGGPLYRGRLGAVRLALQSGFPIVPAGFYVAERDAKTIHATVDGRQTHGRWQIGGTCQVEVGRPWHLGQMAQSESGYGEQRRLTDQLMGEIAALVRQAETRARQ